MDEAEFEFTDAILSEIRKKFAHVERCPFGGERIFFENGGGSLTLNSVVEASARFAAIPDNQGRNNVASHAVTEIINSGVGDARLFLNAKDGEVFYGESGTEIQFRMIRHAILGSSEGGNVVGSTLEHPSTSSAAMIWASNTGRPYYGVKHNSVTGSVDADDYAQVITEETKVATIVQTSPVSGMGVDVADVVKTIRSIAPECFIIVDGIQHAAHGHVDVASYNIDGYAISPYKMFSRHGYAIGWVSERLKHLPHEGLIHPSGQYKDLGSWELGTRDVGAYGTFSEVVRYLEWLGAQFTDHKGRRQKLEAAATAIHVHESKLTRTLLSGTGNYQGLADMPSVEIIGGAENPRREGLISFNVEGIGAAKLAELLEHEGIRVHDRHNDIYSGGVLNPLGLDSCVRISLCHYNSLDEVGQFLAVMNKLTA